MANFVSPGVYTVEKDISTYPVAGNSSIVGIVGFASKGPTNEATLITSPENLISVFGEPNEDIPGQGLEGALEILETTNAIYFVRAATTGAAEATTTVPLGACPAIEVVAGDYGVGTDLYLKAQVTDANGVSKYILPKEFRIPAGTATTQALALGKVVGGAVDGDYIAYQTLGAKTVLVGAFAGSAASLSVSAYSNDTFSTPIPSSLKVIYFNQPNGPAANEFNQYLVNVSAATTNVASAGTYNFDGTTSSFIVSSTFLDPAGSAFNGSAQIFLSAVGGAGWTGVSAGSSVTVGEMVNAIARQASSIQVGAVAIGTGFRIKTASGNAALYATQKQFMGPQAKLTVYSSDMLSRMDLSSGTFFGGGIDARFGSSLLTYGANFVPSSVAYKVESLYPGEGYNYALQTDGSVKGNSIEIDAVSQDKVILTVNDKGAATETFKVGLGSSVFVEDMINTGDTNLKSEYIKARLVASSVDFDAEKLEFNETISNIGIATSGLTVSFGGFIGYQNTLSGGGVISAAAATECEPAFNKLVEGNNLMANGDSGYNTTVDSSENTAAIIGSFTETPKTGMYALDYDDLNISIGVVPGINNQQVQNALITLAESTQNFIALVAPPYGSINTPQEALDWTNGRAETRTAAINSSYAAVHWPWVKVFSVFDGIDRWYDPSIFAARQMCFTDSIADPWYAPAGFQRGRLTKPTEVEVNLNQGDRDSLYSGGNIVNPIVSFPQAGIAIFGQRTAQRLPTALDRINVRRLMIFLRKAVLNSTQSFVFEPNDPFTWESVRGVINPLLEDIRTRRGIVNYAVVCDETTNTPVRVDRNELWCKVIIQPTKAAEVVVFELNVTNQSAQIGG